MVLSKNIVNVELYSEW